MRRSTSGLLTLAQARLLTTSTLVRFFWAAVLVASLIAPSSVLAEGEAATDGPTLFMASKCNLCHSVETADIQAKTKSEKLAGPDLSAHVTADEDVAALARFLRKQEDGERGPHKREFKGTDEELQLILDWLASTPAKPDTADQGS